MSARADDERLLSRIERITIPARFDLPARGLAQLPKLSHVDMSPHPYVVYGAFFLAEKGADSLGGPRKSKRPASRALFGVCRCPEFSD